MVHDSRTFKSFAAPVSYTHLDVYKRQHQDDGQQSAGQVAGEEEAAHGDAASGGGVDDHVIVDISAMALQALAKYQDQKAGKSATDKALTYLSKVQDIKGGFSSWGTTNVESVAQVVVALCELGISLDAVSYTHLAEEHIHR